MLGLIGSTADTRTHSGPVECLPLVSGISMGDICLVFQQPQMQWSVSIWPNNNCCTTLPILPSQSLWRGCTANWPWWTCVWEPSKQGNDGNLALHSRGKWKNSCQISSQESVGHVSDTETVQNDSQPPHVDGPQTPAPVEGSLLPGLVDEPAHQTPILPTAILTIAKAVVRPKASVVPPAIHLQDSAPLFVEAGYNQGRHGPHDCLALQQTLLNITVSRSRIVSLSSRGMWTFHLCIRQTVCKGCDGTMSKNCPRLSWDPRTTQISEGLRAMPGYNRGNWHVSCALLASKISVPRNCLREVDMAMVGQLSGATANDAPIIEAMVEKQNVFLRASLGV